MLNTSSINHCHNPNSRSSLIQCPFSIVCMQLYDLSVQLYSNFLSLVILILMFQLFWLCSVIDHAVFPHHHSYTSPTHTTNVSSTTINLMLSSSPELTGNCTMIPPLGTSDHLGLLASVSLKSPRSKPAISWKVW